MFRSTLGVRWVVTAVAALACSAPADVFDFGSETERIAHFHLSGTLTETPREDPFGLFADSTTSLKSLIDRLDQARRDESVKAVVLTFDGMSMGLGQMEELHNEIAKFKVDNKRVFVHVDGLNTGTYALLSAASDLCVVPTADIWLTGLYGERLFLKGLLDMLGIEADILQKEAYKSAGETLTRENPTEASTENINWLLDGLYDSLLQKMADARDMTPKKMRSLIDDGPYTADRAKDVGLIDGVMFRDEFLAKVKKICGPDVRIDNHYAEKDGIELDMSNPFAIFGVLKDMFGPRQKSKKTSIAVVYVEGIIQPGYAQQSLFGVAGGAFSGDIRNALREAADDDSVKAVVLRVDSPGGSALASEIILNAANLVQKKKPLVVSMGNVAGSGGYYVSCGAKTIFADETTITASIGVVGGKLVTTGMWDKVGINWVPHQRGANADLLSSDHSFTDEQRKRIDEWMEEIYVIFKDHVVKGRGNKLAKPIGELAGGRVFTGEQAQELGLVDKIGGFSDAVAYAAREAGISSYELRVIPEPKSFLDMLMEQVSGGGERPSDIHVATKFRLNGAKSPLLEAFLPMLEQFDPMRVKVVMRALKRLELIQKEGVITMMPLDLVIR